MSVGVMSAIDWLGGPERPERDLFAKTDYDLGQSSKDACDSVESGWDALYDAPRKPSDDMIQIFLGFVRQSGGSFRSCDIGKLYDAYPEVKDAFGDIDLKEFCNMHEELAYDSQNDACVLRKVISEEHMVELLIDFAKAEGGSFKVNDLSKLYAHSPDTEEYLEKAGGLVFFCSNHTEFSIDGDLCTLVSNHDDIEFVFVSSVLPAFDYPDRVTKIIGRVRRAVKCVEGAAVHAFGSSVNGFGDKASDIDVVIEATPENLKKGLNLGYVSRRDLAPRSLKFLQNLLKREGFVVVERVLHAKVPILKLKHGKDECDLSCNNLLPVFNTRLFKAYSEIDIRVVELTQKVKEWSRKMGVHGAPLGNFSSYAFTILVIFYMQVRGALPCLQGGRLDPKLFQEGGKTLNVAMDLSSLSAPSQNVEISFSDFASFYVNEYIWGDGSVVSIRMGCIQDVAHYPELKTYVRHDVDSEEAKQLLHIEDPFDLSRNLNCVLSKGSTIKLWCALEAEVASPISEAVTSRGAANGRNGQQRGRRGARTSERKFGVFRDQPRAPTPPPPPLPPEVSKGAEGASRWQ